MHRTQCEHPALLASLRNSSMTQSHPSLQPSLRPFIDLKDENNLFKSPPIPVPARVKGLIIGKGGCIIKQFEQDHHVRIEFPELSPHMQILCNESEDRWRKCEKAIRAHLEQKNWQWNGTTFEERNVLDEKYGSKRDQIAQLAKERNDLFEKSKKAFEEGKKKEAKELADEGHAVNQQLHALKNNIHSSIVRENVKIDDGVVDLHGLEVEQARKVVEQALDQWRQVPAKTRAKIGGLNIITGRGVHSEGSARVKPAILHMLKAKGIEHESVNSGSVVVKV